MSATSNDAADGAGKRPRAAVNLGKSGTSPTGDSKPGGAVAVPRTINLAGAALGAMVLGMVLRAVGFSGSTATMRQYLIHLNSKAKSPKKNYDPTSDLSNLRHSALESLVLVAVIVALLIWAMRRTRSASPSRWVLIVILVIMQIPLLVIPSAGWPSTLPALARVGGVLAGLASIAALALVFIPRSSQQYFRASREAAIPPEMRGQRRPGLGSLFAPRPRGAAGTTRPAATRPANTRPDTSTAANRSTAPRARAKGRADADAVAKGAELARSRAKASKSRRTGG